VHRSIVWFSLMYYKCVNLQITGSVHLSLVIVWEHFPLTARRLIVLYGCVYTSLFVCFFLSLFISSLPPATSSPKTSCGVTVPDCYDFLNWNNRLIVGLYNMSNKTPADAARSHTELSHHKYVKGTHREHPPLNWVPGRPSTRG